MNHPKSITQITDLNDLAEAANTYAASQVFNEYRQQKSKNTLRAQDNDLSRFVDILTELIQSTEVNVPMVTADDLARDPYAWRDISHGLINLIKKAMLQHGYSVATVNRTLATVKVYAGLSFTAGVIDETRHALIKTVKGYTPKTGKRIDETRAQSRLEDSKKATHTSISEADRQALMNQHDGTAQGMRNRVVMTLMLQLGLRVGEIASLTVDSFDLESGQVTFYREKVDLTQTHDLLRDTLHALRDYKNAGLMPSEGKLLRAILKNGKPGKRGLSTRAIYNIVKKCGEEIGIDDLAPHDLRHNWATKAAKESDLFTLQEAGGWSSMAMPRRYVEAAKVANRGIKLGNESA